MDKKIIVFLVDNILNIVYNSKVINIKMDGILYKGRIVDRLKFMEEFNKILKKEKIKTRLFGDNIYVVKNMYFREMDIFYLDNIFMEMGFNKVIYVDIRKLMPDMNATFIEINDTYMVIDKDEGLFLDLDFFKDIPKIINYLQEYIEGDIVLFGVNKIIPKLRIEGINLYYLDDYAGYITNCLLKVKKYGV